MSLRRFCKIAQHQGLCCFTSTHLPRRMQSIANSPGTACSPVITDQSDDGSVLMRASASRDAVLFTLNRPKALNSLNLPMIRYLFPFYSGFADGNPVATERTPALAPSKIILTGAGDKAFCAGGDVRILVEEGDRTREELDALRIAFFLEEYRLNSAIQRLRRKAIAILDGIVMGGGVGLSVHGGYRIATEKTVFAMPETSLGLFPDVGGSWFLPRLACPQVGLFLALVGHRLKGFDVVKASVATHYVDSVKIPELLALLMGESGAGGDRNIAACLDAVGAVTASASLPNNVDTLLPLIRRHFPLPAYATNVGDIIRSLEEEAASGTGGDAVTAGKFATVLQRCSPISLTLTFELFMRGFKAGSMDEALVNEYFVAQHLVTRPEISKDFYEGVRAILIDKDNKPQWYPSSLQDITPAMVDNYFTRLPGVPVYSPRE